MEFLFDTIIGEAIFELLFAGGEYAVRNSKIPKPVRYLIAVIGLLFFLAIIGLIGFTGVSIIIETSIIGGSIILAAAVLIVVVSFKKLRKVKINT